MRRAGSLLLGFAACFVLGAAPAGAAANCPATLGTQVAAGNPGNATVAWVQQCTVPTTEVVASSSSAPGIFPAATVVSPPGPGVQLLGNVVSDAAGDAWIFGTSNRVVYGPKATQDLEITGRWVAFRPAGGSFTTTPLPAGIVQTSNVTVSPAGRIALAWITPKGDTAIATADRSATFSLLGVQRGFLVSSLGIDAAGSITLAGVPSTPFAGAYRWVEVLTQRTTGGGFAKTIVDRLARPNRSCAHHGPPPTAGGPKLAIAPSGATLLAWTVLLERCPSARSTGMVAARPGDGQGFGRGIRFSTDLASYGFTGGVAVDDSGHGLVGWQRRNSHFVVDVVDPQGHPARRATDLGRGAGALLASPGGAAAATIVDYLSAGTRVSLSTGSTTAGLGAPQPVGTGAGSMALDSAGTALVARAAAPGVTVQGYGPAPFGPVTVTAVP